MRNERRWFLLLLVTAAAFAGEAPVAPDFHVNTCPKPYLAMLYSEPDFRGKAEGLTEPNKGVTRTFASFRVAPGYRLRLTTKDNWLEESRMYVMAEDAARWPKEFTGERCQVLVEPATKAPRPRIFMAIHGANELAEEKNTGAWRYVQRNLDGLWLNLVGTKPQEQQAIFRSVRSRTVFSKDMLNGKLERAQANLMGNRLDDGRELDREAIAIWRAGEGLQWTGDEVKDIRNRYVTAHLPPADRWMLHRNVYIGFLGGIKIRPGEALSPPVKIAVESADGLWTECPYFPKWPFFRLVHEAHANPRGMFMWFVGNDDLGDETRFMAFKSAYYKLEAEGLVKASDVIMLINYGGKVPCCPELEPITGLPPRTLSGNLNWLLHQGQLSRVNAVKSARDYLKKGDEWSAWVVLERMVRYTSQGDLPTDGIEPTGLAQAMAMLQVTGQKVRAKDWAAVGKEVEAVIAHLEKTPPTSQVATTGDPSNKPVAQNASAFDAGALPQWTERLRAYLKETITAGARPQCRLNLMADKPSAVKLLAADDQGLTVELDGGKLPVPWSQLKTLDYAALAQGCNTGQDARSHVLAGVFLCASGRIEDGRTWLAKAVLADPQAEGWVKEAREALKDAQP